MAAEKPIEVYQWEGFLLSAGPEASGAIPPGQTHYCILPDQQILVYIIVNYVSEDRREEQMG